MQPAGSVEDHRVASGEPRFRDALAGDDDRVRPVARIEDGYADLTPEDLQLGDRRGSREVRRHEQGISPARLQV
jgi:hypothetical protein